nr:STAS domain-containing protein [Rhodoferax sp. PAMC 29310]
MLVLPQALTQVEATACLRSLVQDLRKQSGARMVVDASALTRFDSAALAVLLEFRREVMALGKQFSIRGLPARLADLATLYGIDELLTAESADPVK